jgi:hypothetical protein
MELIELLKRANAQFTVEPLWRNFSILNPKDCAASESNQSNPADIVQLIRYAMGLEAKLARFSGVARQRYELWLGRKKNAGVEFSDSQRVLLSKIAELIISNLAYSAADFKTHNQSLYPQAVDAGLKPFIPELYKTLVS